MVRLALLTFITVLAGCASFEPPAAALEGQPPPYRDGFTAGCDSGLVAAGHGSRQWRKDVPRFDTDRLYASGWQDGYVACKGRYEAAKIRL